MYCPRLIHLGFCQNKKRKYGRDRDDDDVGRERTPEESEDPLKDATTLYVGNLCVKGPWLPRRKLTSRRSFYTTEEQIHELFAKYVAYASSLDCNTNLEVDVGRSKDW